MCFAEWLFGGFVSVIELGLALVVPVGVNRINVWVRCVLQSGCLGVS